MSHYFYITPDEYKEAEKNGVDPANLERRVRLLGWKKAEAIEKPLCKMTDRKHWAAVAKENGIGYHTFMNRVNTSGWDEEKAATTPVISKRSQVDHMNRKKKRVVPREVMPIAKANGIAYHTLRMRIKKGMDPEEAARKPLMSVSDRGKLGARAYEKEYGRFHELIFK